VRTTKSIQRKLKLAEDGRFKTYPLVKVSKREKGYLGWYLVDEQRIEGSLK